MNSLHKMRATLPLSLYEIFECRLCKLSEKSKPIHPRGNFLAKTMMLGEAPGRVEEEENLFFIGPAGEELEKACNTLGIPLDVNFFINNTVQCRPHPPPEVKKENRAPTPEEIETCRPNLDKIIEAHQPKLIILIGKIAARAVMKEPPKTVGEIVGKFFGPDSHTLNCNADLYSIWHPAYILRNREKKKEWMMDLVKLRDYMKGRNLLEKEVRNEEF